MFSDCDSLTEIEIPEGVTEIEGYAFNSCSGLIEITIPKSVKRINEYVFHNCKNLKTVYYKGSKANWEAIDKSEFFRLENSECRL